MTQETTSDTPVTPTASTPAPQPEPTPSPAPAPVSQAPAAPAAAVTDAPVFGPAVAYEKTGFANLDTVIAWAGSLGLDTDTSPEMRAASEGDFGPLRALLATKNVPGADAYLALAEAGYREYHDAQAQRLADVQNMVVQAAGDADTWACVMAWAQDNADQDEKEVVNHALAQGGFLAEAVAMALVNNYRQQTGVSNPPRQQAARASATGTAPADGHGPLSPKAYAQAVLALRQSAKGQPLEGHPGYAALQRRRAAWRG